MPKLSDLIRFKADIKLNKDHEYFLAIASQEVRGAIYSHSFIMLGVVKDGEAGLIGRFDKTVVSPSLMGLMRPQQAFLHARNITQEGVPDKAINYQAYSINLEQFKECLALVGDIEIQQQYESEGLERPSPIWAYTPIEEERDGTITFKYQEVRDFYKPSDEKFKMKIRQATQEMLPKFTKHDLFRERTCRTSALDLLKKVLGFETPTSKKFYISPRYKSKLNYGQPELKTFYIFPPPPNTLKDVSAEGDYVSKLIYKRLEEIPKLKPNSLKTRKKFEALNSLYKNVYEYLKEKQNKPNLPSDNSEFIWKVLEHSYRNKYDLLQKRSTNFFTKFLSISATEKMFNNIEKKFKSIDYDTFEGIKRAAIKHVEGQKDGKSNHVIEQQASPEKEHSPAIFTK